MIRPMKFPSPIRIVAVFLALVSFSQSKVDLGAKNPQQAKFLEVHSRLLAEYQEGDFAQAINSLKVLEGILKQRIASEKGENARVVTSPEFEALHKRTRSPLSIPVSGEVLKVDLGSSTFFISPEGVFHEYLVNYRNPRSFRLYFSHAGKPLTMNRYLKTKNGEALEVSLSSSNPKVVKIGKKSGEITFEGPGECIVKIAVGPVSSEFALRVIEIPLGKSAVTAEGLVSKFGLPSKESSVNVFWPESERLDGVFYGYSNDTRMRKITHWQYKDYPGAILSFEGEVDELEGLRNPTWEKLDLLFLKN
jgi:hypothetical protein